MSQREYTEDDTYEALMRCGFDTVNREVQQLGSYVREEELRAILKKHNWTVTMYSRKRKEYGYQ